MPAGRDMSCDGPLEAVALVFCLAGWLAAGCLKRPVVAGSLEDWALLALSVWIGAMPVAPAAGPAVAPSGLGCGGVGSLRFSSGMSGRGLVSPLWVDVTGEEDSEFWGEAFTTPGSRLVAL